MGLNRRLLKGLIVESDKRNSNGIYTEEDVIGVSTAKRLIPTKAKLEGVNLNNYKLLLPGYFAFVADTSRRGDKMALAYNNTNRTYIVSTWYVVFYISKEAEKVILPDYLFMYFNRPEFDRYARINSWGSAREYFWFSDMENIELDLPSISIQQKYIDVYNAMNENQKSYERGLEDLKEVCDAYIEDLRRNMPCTKIGKYLVKTPKNTDEKIKRVLGIGQSGFIPPQKAPNSSLKNYKILTPNCICYAPPLYNIMTGALHLYRDNSLAVCSPIYEVFECDNSNLLAAYLELWLKREEFKRYAAYYALGVRQTFDYQLMEEVAIPIPEISIQNSIIGISNAYKERQEINERLKIQIKEICPILIKGSIDEARKIKEV